MTFLNTEVFYFTYDPQGHPATVKWNNHVYYYITNLQGDVIAILDQGTVVVEYKYDAWGKLLSITGSEAQVIGRLNPLRYRGYVYDQETQLYYLQSRYYNPEWGRFLNADALVSTGGLLGNNMFAYCGNNPVTRYDPTGREYFLACYSDGRAIQAMLQYRSLGGCCSGGDLSSYSGPITGSGDYLLPLTHTDPLEAREDLRNNGFTFYKGKLVIMAPLPFDETAASFGIILMDDYYGDTDDKEFADTLNHEYGHAVHASQVGLPVYFATTAIPSLIGAVLSRKVEWIDKNYYSLPWERTADYLGGVDRGDYLSGSNTAATLFWLQTQVAGIMWEILT